MAGGIYVEGEVVTFRDGRVLAKGLEQIISMRLQDERDGYELFQSL